MLTNEFTSQLAANLEENFIAFRIKGGEMVYLASSHDKDIAQSNDSDKRLKYKVAGDVIKIYRPMATPQGPQINTVSVIAIEDIYELVFFYDPGVHTDFTMP